MIKNIFIFFLFLSFTSYGQVKLEGIVKDSLKVPLESASLVAIDQKTNNLESYVLTDIKGKYKLNLKNNSNYKIQVSYIGLRTINETLDTKEARYFKRFCIKV